MKSTNFIALFLPVFIFGLGLKAADVKSVSVADFKKIEALLNDELVNLQDDEVCKMTDVKHSLHLKMNTNNTFNILSTTVYKCEGQEGQIKGESCRIVKDNNVWILDYCDN